VSGQATFAATVADELARSLVVDAVVSPGSRSTPLAVALAREARLRVHVVLDERSAGFVALGLAMATGRPALALTTSGTAAVELHPAVVEAHQAGVPLLVATADRPPELHEVGAPQTVSQVGLYGAATRWAAVLDADALPASAWRSLVSRAVAESVDGPRGPGPVHLNLPFREPLLGEPGELPPGRHDDLPWHERLQSPAPPPAETVSALAEAGERGIIVAGGGAGSAAAVHAAAAHLGWPVLADPRSGCRVPGPATVAAADALLRDGALARSLAPDVVLRLGGAWASRVLATWLAEQGEALHILVDPYGHWTDPDRQAGWVLGCDPTALCKAITARPPGANGDGSWPRRWAAAEAAAQAAIDRVLEGHGEPTEPGVARSLVRHLPDGAVLVTAASMPLRDVEWYGPPRTGLRVVANRGANGIDGVLSTAVGLAAGLGLPWPAKSGVVDPAGPGASRPGGARQGASGPVVALLGDLALLHDAGGLLSARWTGASLTLVVVDNAGGGIFSFLPQAAALPRPEFERLFGTPPGLDPVDVLGGYGVRARVVDRAGDVGPAVMEATAQPGVQAVVARTERAANVDVHDEIHAAVTAAVAGQRSARGGRRRRAGPAA
jgi:2-succinyl-5-enolpyruvyl-6-hydroxy-3-cyclohexene-1-carboxylate synthase